LALTRGRIGTSGTSGSRLRVDIFVKFVIDIIVTLVMGITDFLMEAALKVFAFGYGILIVLVTGFLFWLGIALIRRYRRP
jgi:hypothetical protein